MPAQVAKYKIIFVHGLSACRHSPVNLKSLPQVLYCTVFFYLHWVSKLFCPKGNTFQEFIEELGLHILSFDKPGYWESDPHPKQTLKSLALDIEELVHQLELGSKFYVIGYSIGSHLVWGCLKYIPLRYELAFIYISKIFFFFPLTINLFLYEHILSVYYC